MTTAELHNDELRPERTLQIRSLAWQIADQLRAADAVEVVPELLRVLQSTGFATAAERYEAMSALIDRLGNAVNPRYAATVRKISNENLEHMAQGGRGGRHTPALMQ
ncbi:MAG TPA: hypothetical protein VNP72_01110 [Longimicrobium sp.]|nr:hypothetical protein [Longimicrobium sp.]